MASDGAKEESLGGGPAGIMSGPNTDCSRMVAGDPFRRGRLRRSVRCLPCHGPPARPRVQPLCRSRACGQPGTRRRTRRQPPRAVRLGRAGRERGRRRQCRGTLAPALRALRRRVFLHTLVRDLTGRAPLTEVCATHDHAGRRRAAGGRRDARAELTRGARRADRRRDRHGASADRHRHGQAGRRRTQRVVRHRPRVRLSRGRRDRGTARRSPIANTSIASAARVIAALNDVTADGYVFRVDMRLRPYGDSGPLTTSFAGLEHYLVTQGRAWERYAWLKARAITGDAPRRARRARVARSSIASTWTTTRTRSCATSIGRSATRATRRDYADNVKLGDGGIREIEFIVQAHADRARRTRARPARPRHAAGARGARRARAAAAVLRRARCATPTSSCATSSIGCSTATTSRRISCRRIPASARCSPKRWTARPPSSTRRSRGIARSSSITFAQTLGDDGRATNEADAAVHGGAGRTRG